MKLAGLLSAPEPDGRLLLTAIAVLPPGPARTLAFVYAGLGVESLGMAVVVRAHMPEPAEQRRGS